ncbi:MAG: SDR family oxidoreductase [Bdellovibrionales bacterium]|nr:SDR family oxidoreductase [Bdellovibrionales bacterium]
MTPQPDLSGKFAVVTGGTRGIGRAISLSLAARGARVVALYARDREHAEKLELEAREQKLTLTTLKGDLTDDESFKKVVASLKESSAHVDILVHSAASGVHRAAMELSPRHLKWTFEINVFAFHSLMRELVPLMPSGARVIGITSSGGTRVIPFYAAVGASKGALESLLRHYASELAPRGIAVNCVCPGMVLTDAVDAFPDRDARIAKATGATPSGRLTNPEEVAELVSFLSSPAAAQIIGQTFTIDGGKTLSS